MLFKKKAETIESYTEKTASNGRIIHCVLVLALENMPKIRENYPKYKPIRSIISTLLVNPQYKQL